MTVTISNDWNEPQPSQPEGKEGHLLMLARLHPASTLQTPTQSHRTFPRYHTGNSFHWHAQTTADNTVKKIQMNSIKNIEHIK